MTWVAYEDDRATMDCDVGAPFCYPQPLGRVRLFNGSLCCRFLSCSLVECFYVCGATPGLLLSGVAWGVSGVLHRRKIWLVVDAPLLEVLLPRIRIDPWKEPPERKALTYT